MDALIPFTTSGSLVDVVDKKVLIVLRDGRNLIGVLRSYDQFANLVLENTIERLHHRRLYADQRIPQMLVPVSSFASSSHAAEGAQADAPQQQHQGAGAFPSLADAAQHPVQRGLGGGMQMSGGGGRGAFGPGGMGAGAGMGPGGPAPRDTRGEEGMRNVCIIRGENVVLLGEVDLDMEDEVPLQPAAWSEVAALDKAEKDRRKRTEPVREKTLRSLGFTNEGQEGDAY